MSIVAQPHIGMTWIVGIFSASDGIRAKACPAMMTCPSMIHDRDLLHIELGGEEDVEFEQELPVSSKSCHKAPSVCQITIVERLVISLQPMKRVSPSPNSCEMIHRADAVRGGDCP